MLRRVYLDNFVKFKGPETIDFAEGESPYIFVGENGSGKSSLLEGIRRCLSQTTSTTKSSVFDVNKPGFCICKFDLRKCLNQALKECPFMFTGIIRNKKENTIYKFASTENELLINKYDVDNCYQFQSTENTKDFFGKFENNNWKFDNIFEREFTEIVAEESALERKLTVLEDHVILTFPLRSIGPLQWSRSNRIRPNKRKENYEEAGKRAEIIDYFLSNKDKFDENVEQEIFCDLTGQTGIQFDRSADGGINVHSKNKTLLAEQEYALLKLPEGILEAKHFSILMSNKQFLTVVLEEPDRGMHPQMVERMLAVIEKESNKKLVILTTHNTSFVTPRTITRLVIFKQIKDHTETILGTKIAKVKLPRTDSDESSHDMPSMKTLRILTRDHLADLIFAKRILFCEGDSDYLFLSALKEKVMKRADCVKNATDMIKGDDRIQKLNILQRVCVSLQIINMNGWANASLMHILCSDDCLKLDDHYFVCDKDAILTTGDKDVNNDNKWLATEGGFETIRGDYQKNKESGEDAWAEARKRLRKSCKCFSWKDGTIEDMVISLLRSETEEIKSKDDKRYDQVLSWKQKQNAIDALADQNVVLPYDRWKKRRHQRDDKTQKLFLSSKITQENVAKSLEIILNACDNSTDDLVQFISFLLEMEKVDPVA